MIDHQQPVDSVQMVTISFVLCSCGFVAPKKLTQSRRSWVPSHRMEADFGGFAEGCKYQNPGALGQSLLILCGAVRADYFRCWNPFTTGPPSSMAIVGPFLSSAGPHPWRSDAHYGPLHHWSGLCRTSQTCCAAQQTSTWVVHKRWVLFSHPKRNTN